MLQPRRTKYRKTQRGRRAGRANSGNSVAFGDFGLQALGTCWMTARQIEAGRRAITRYVRRGGKLWIRVFPDKPVTKKPLETRQGKGKAPVEFWVATVKPGRIIYEIAGVREESAREAMRLAAHKLPIHTRFVAREVAL
jgi:large subunit ribosomal protein L16